MSLGSRPSWLRKVAAMAALAVLCAFNANAAAKWTFMVYMDGDNNLEDNAIDNFLSMAAVGGSTDVDVVALFDRIPGYDSRYGDWVTTRRGEILRNDVPDTAWGEDLGELNMGDPATLEDFVVWTKANHPAENYILVLWNHGSGWIYKTLSLGAVKGICYDDTNGGDCLNLKEVRGALEPTANNVTLLGMDACLMAMVEVADEFQHTGASYMVSSEEVVPGEGWPYKDIVGDLVANPSMGPGTLATDIAARYRASYAQGMTMSVIQLDRVPDLVASVDALSLALLGGFDAADSAPVVKAANATIAELDKAVVADFHGPGWPRAGGVTIEFLETGVPRGYTAANLDFVAQTHWADFLAAYPADSDNWIGDVRAGVQNFYLHYPDFVDLRDLCSLLANYQAPQGLYNERVIPSMFKEGGVAMGWKADEGGAWAFDLPFDFKFNGATVSKLWVASNGFLDLTADGAIANSYPSMYYNENSFRNASMVAPFWAPLSTAKGDIYVDTSLADRASFRWVGNLISDSSPVEFQATLFASGQVRFDYGAGNACPSGALVGVSSGDPSRFTFSTYDGSDDLDSVRSSMLVPVDAVIAARDYNGDFKSDMLWATDKLETLYMDLLTGAHVDQQGFLMSFSKNWAIGGSGDFNGDCNTDLLLLNKEGSVRVCLLDGFNSFSTTNILDGFKGWAVAAVADFDGDGLSDFLLGRSGDLLMVLMDGKNVKEAGLIFEKQKKVQFLGAGDFNGDGKADLLTWDKGEKNYKAYLMSGITVTASGVLNVSEKRTKFYAIADLNGDGKADLVLNRGKTPYLVTLNGLVITSTGDLFDKGKGREAAGVGDFNADGKADLLIWDKPNKMLTVFLMDGTSSTGAFNLAGIDYKNWYSVDVADYNGDGKADIGFYDKPGNYVVYITGAGSWPEVVGTVATSAAKWLLYGLTH